MPQFVFDRDQIHEAAEELGFARLKNAGGLIYNLRHNGMPKEIADKAPTGMEWIILGEPDSSDEYRVQLVPISRIEPDRRIEPATVPDSTPGLVIEHRFSDEQALLARIRYNRLVDLFTGVVAYSLQNHLRTKVRKVQLEVDELYLGLSRDGEVFVLPIQAKVGESRFGRVQLEQDLEFCREKFGQFRARALAAQDLGAGLIAMYELAIERDRIVKRAEQHFRLRKPRSKK